jgi:hypothetical protein
MFRNCSYRQYQDVKMATVRIIIQLHKWQHNITIVYWNVCTMCLMFKLLAGLVIHMLALECNHEQKTQPRNLHTDNTQSEREQNYVPSKQHSSLYEQFKNSH